MRQLLLNLGSDLWKILSLLVARRLFIFELFDCLQPVAFVALLVGHLGVNWDLLLSLAAPAQVSVPVLAASHNHLLQTQLPPFYKLLFV